MKRLERILVAVDLGADTEAVIAASRAMATLFHAQIRLLYVIEGVPHFPEALDLLTQGAQERLSELERSLMAQGVHCESSMHVVGRPFESITGVANAMNAQLIVMGRGTRRGSGAEALGNTVSRVMRRATQPVVAVAHNSTGEIRRILCPVDGSSPSARGLHNAISLARALGARLTVMTVIADFSLHPAIARRATDMTRIASDYEKMERAQFEQFLTKFEFGSLAWDKEVRYGHPADEIVALAESAKYDLVVLGSTGRSGLPRILLGSTAETVARRVHCSVLTVKREDVLPAQLDADIADLNRWLAEGHELLEQGRIDEANLRFDQCLLKDSYFAPAIEGLSIAQERLGNSAEAAELREQAALIRRELWQQHSSEVATA